MRLHPRLLALLLALSPLSSLADQTIYVAPDGRDTWTGRLQKPAPDASDGPLATLAAARDAARKIRAAGALNAPLHIVLADGEYPLSQPVVFSPEDSGTEAAPTLIEAAPGARPVLFGGKRIAGFQLDSAGRWTAVIPEVREGKWLFEQLFVNGKRATRARTPNEFYQYATSKVTQATDPATGQPADLSNRAFRFRKGDIKNWPNLSDVLVVAYHSWEVSRHRLASVDDATRTAIFSGPAPWAFFYWGSLQRYHVENTPEALDAPGEWFLARDGALTYIPRPGENPATADVVAPVTDAFISLEGQPEANRLVQNISFTGLSFRYSQYLTPPQGHGDPQAAVSIPATITADGASNITLDRCDIAHIGTYAVHFRRGCQNCRVLNSRIHDSGAGGVRIGETTIRPEGPERTGHCTVDNTIIHQAGRVFPGAIGVWIGQSADNIITHNDISDLFYTAVSVGWTWGYGPSLGVNNHIDNNHLHHIGWGVLSDMGAVYTLGISPGTTVNHNHVHDVHAFSYGGWGLYNDEGSSHILLRDNLVYRTKTGGYHQHYGRENLIENNIFAFARDAQLQRSRIEPHLSFTFRKNIVVWDQGALFSGNWHDGQVALDHNLYWNYAGEPVLFEGKSLQDWQATGQDKGSIVADPKFANPPKEDYTLATDSPALALGFVPIDYAQAGLRSGDNPWSGELKKVSYPELRIAPPQPLAIEEDFETSAPGSPPPVGSPQTEGKGDLLQVTESAAASGRRSLEFVDAPGLQHAFNPHLALQPNASSGKVVGSFDLRLQTPSVFFHEWRQNGSPYLVGPSLWIHGNKLALPNVNPVELPLEQWIHFEIRTGLGPDSTGTWSLSVQPQGGQKLQWNNLAFGSPSWKNLEWVVYVSNANDRTLFQLDNLSLVESQSP